MILFPNAKINIGLNILDRRPDGYHNLETIFYPVAIRDVLEVVEAEKLLFTSSGLPIPGKPEANLCLKAYQLMAKDHKLPPIHIHLHKHIPIGAGLGGGSSDAGFFIKLINEKFSLGLNKVRMEDYASRLGSDCTFFIENKPSFGFEKGDKFKKIELDLSKYFVVLIMPQVHVSTSEAYKDVKISAVSDSLYDIIKTPVDEWRLSIRNDFETGVFSKYPVIAEIKSTLYKAGAIYASMSGSGASVYGIFKEELKLPVLEKSNQVFYKV